MTSSCLKAGRYASGDRKPQGNILLHRAYAAPSSTPPLRYLPAELECRYVNTFAVLILLVLCLVGEDARYSTLSCLCSVFRMADLLYAVRTLTHAHAIFIPREHAVPPLHVGWR